MSHSLLEIPSADWVNLSHLYNDRGKEASSCSMLHTIIKWHEQDSALNIKIFALDGDWKNDGTFILVLNGLNCPHISFNTLNNDLERITTALNCLDTNLKYLIFAFPQRLKPAVADHLKYADIDVAQFSFDAAVWYHIEKQQAMQFETDAPTDHQLLPLEERHAVQVNSFWPHHSAGSIEFVKLLINHNESIGLFDKAGDLIAWCLRLHIGSLGLLQVIDSHQRKGFGNLVVRHMAKIIASKNEEVTAAVVTTNAASRAMFEKLGFSVIDNVYWALKLSK